jgi:hypothetical protein
MLETVERLGGGAALGRCAASRVAVSLVTYTAVLESTVRALSGYCMSRGFTVTATLGAQRADNTCNTNAEVGASPSN